MRIRSFYRVKGINDLNKQVCLKKKLLYIIIFGITGLVFVGLFSYSTSPLYPGSYGHDSAIFQMVGKEWLDGRIPYRDMFDHKGPLIYALASVGYLLGGRSGIYVIQVLFFTGLMIYAYKICRLYTGKWQTALILAVMLLLMSRTFDEGNMTEEYSCFFLLCCFYYILKYMLGKYEEHPPSCSIIYGGAVGAMLLLRVTNALPLFAAGAVIGVHLIRRKLWKNILHNAVAFLAGLALPVLIFSLYFAYYGLLYELWYGTLLFNISYSMESSGQLQEKLSLILWIMIPSSLVYLFRYRSSPIGYWTLLASAASGLMLLISRGYDHYYLLLVPYITLVGLLLSGLWAVRRKVLCGIIIGTVLLQCVFAAAYLPVKLNIANRLEWNRALNESARSCVEQIPQPDRDSVLFYNLEAQWYLTTGIEPCMKYFVLQDWHAQVADDVRRDIETEFLRSSPKWVVTRIEDNLPAVEHNGIKEALLNNYKLYYRYQSERLSEMYGVYKMN